MHLLLDHFPSPVGTITLITDADGALRALDFEDYDERMRQLLARYCGPFDLQPGAAPQPTRDALTAYFAGDHAALACLTVTAAGTPFQRRVWAALRTIPPGTTATYGAIAATLGKPGGSRAVGLANGANPVAIVVPCHRVIGSDSSLTGFGGGLHRKRWLLQHEGVQLRPETNPLLLLPSLTGEGRPRTRPTT